MMRVRVKNSSYPHCNKLIFNVFSVVSFLFTCFFAVSVFAYGGQRPEDQTQEKGMNSLGIHFGGNSVVNIEFNECNWGEHSYLDQYGVCRCEQGYENQNGECVKTRYCAKTNKVGVCKKGGWKSCDYDSSGNKIIGIPNAKGACAESENDHVVCESTNKYGACDEWISCPKTAEYHNIIGTPDAMFPCCNEFPTYCEKYNQEGKCVSWKCKYACSPDYLSVCEDAESCSQQGGYWCDMDVVMYDTDGVSVLNRQKWTDCVSSAEECCPAGYVKNASYGNLCERWL